MIDQKKNNERLNPERLPGDPTVTQLVERMIRVDHAGEFGAARIYEGQLAVLKNHPSAQLIQHMAEKERKHLDHFEELIVERGIRPTVLSPVWHLSGFILGAASAALGKDAAMACTEAVETVIDKHYEKQINQLGPDEQDLKEALQEFRRDEIDHRDSAIESGAKNAPGYQTLGATVRASTRLAIWLSERL